MNTEERPEWAQGPEFKDWTVAGPGKIRMTFSGRGELLSSSDDLGAELFWIVHRTGWVQMWNRDTQGVAFRCKSAFEAVNTLNNLRRILD